MADQQPIRFERVNKVVINDNRGRPIKDPSLCKSNPWNVRFDARIEKDIVRAIQAERSNKTDFINKTAEVGICYSYSQIDTLINESEVFQFLISNPDVLNLVKKITKKFLPVCNTGVERE